MKKLFLQLALAASVITLAACGGDGGGAGTVTPTNPPIQAAVNARYQLVLKDIVTDAPITDPLVLSFSGSAVVKSADGTVLNGTSLTTSAGFYAVDAKFTGAGDEFTVRVTDSGDRGWVATGVTISAEAGATGDRLVELKLLNINRAAQINASAAPVAADVETTSVAAGGAITAAVTATTPTKTVTTEEGTREPLPTVELSIAAGTVARTASGAPAAAGQLTVTSAVFSTGSVESLQAFPGGFAPTVQVSAGNTGVLNGAAPGGGAAVTAGFAQFSVKDSQGNEIKNFDTPVTIEFDVAKGTVDASGNALVAGSRIPVWSFNETTQKWVFETQGMIAEKTPVDPNFFTVRFQTSHLSWWSWFFWRPACNPTVTITGRPAGDARALAIDVVGTRATRFWRGAVTTGNSVVFSRLPTNTTATVTVRDRGVIVGRVEDSSICTGVTVPVTIVPAPTGTVRFETSESCADGSSQRAAPTFVNLVRNGQLTPSYTGTIEGSLASVSVTGLSVGSVRASAFNPRTELWESQTVTVTANGTIVTPFRFIMPCSVVTGGG